MDKHWVWLTERNGIGVRGRTALLRVFGTAERIYALTESECRESEEFQKHWLVPLMDKNLSHAERVVEECDKKKIKLLTYADEAYPERLRNIPDPPTVLYYVGTLPRFDEEAAVAVVGTRRCSNYGLLQTKQFAKQIAASGGLVISGGARGIDTMALQAALETTMPVVCVLGCGVDVPYPQENTGLFREVIRHGCILSEYPPGTQPNKGNFPARNRIISGLSLGVLVVEAPCSSGALITADFALEQGRDVYAIPANIGIKNSEGTNRLLREGAQMVTDGWDLLSAYAYLFADKLADSRKKNAMEKIWRVRFQRALALYAPVVPQNPFDKKSVDIPVGKPYSDKKELIQSAVIAQDKPRAASPLPEVSADERILLERLLPEPMEFDELVEKSELPAARVTAALTLLQVKQLVQKTGSTTYRRI